jgi:MscS family membrane protein
MTALAAGFLFGSNGPVLPDFSNAGRWALVPLLLAGALLAGRLLSWLTTRALRRLTVRTATTWDDVIVDRMSGPLTAGWAVAATFVATPHVGIPPVAADILNRGLKIVFVAAVFWAVFRLVNVAGDLMRTSGWFAQRLASRALVALGERTLKIAIAVVAGVTLLAQLGYPVASLIAGLGIGGLALALAAQKTVENLFGAFSIAIDEPFHHGDFVRIEDVMGTIEVMGLRSTRVRTADRTLVAIPNGKLAELRIENFAVRDRLRLACTVSLVYQTTAEQMRRVLTGLDGVLRAQPKLWPDNVIVKFKELAQSSLDIEVIAWFQTRDWAEFQMIRQDVLLGFMGVVESVGTAFAYPTRTLRVVPPPGGAPPPTKIGPSGAAH